VLCVFAFADELELKLGTVLVRIAWTELVELDATELELADETPEPIELDFTELRTVALELEVGGLCVVVVVSILEVLGVAEVDDEEALLLMALELEELNGLTVEALELELLKGFVLEVELVGLGLGVPIMTVPLLKLFA